MLQAVNFKTKYIALLLCVMIVVTVAGGAVCLWLGNTPSTASFGVFPTCAFFPVKPISLSRTRLPKSEAWIASYDVYDASNTSNMFERSVFGEFSLPFLPFSNLGQAECGGQIPHQKEIFVLRI